jgi:hypothetical protein
MRLECRRDRQFVGVVQGEHVMGSERNPTQLPVPVCGLCLPVARRSYKRLRKFHLAKKINSKIATEPTIAQRPRVVLFTK